MIKLLFRIVYTQVFYSTLLNSLFPNFAARVKYHRAAPHTADLGIRKDFANYKDEALEIFPTIVWAGEGRRPWATTISPSVPHISFFLFRQPWATTISSSVPPHLTLLGKTTIKTKSKCSKGLIDVISSYLNLIKVLSTMVPFKHLSG